MYRSSSMGRRSAPILIGVGALQVGLALFFVIGLSGIPFAGPAMVGTGAVLGLVGAVMIGGGIIWLRRAADSDRISESGLAGTGLITGLTQTGMMLNDQPVIEIDMLVTVPGRAPYAAQVKQAVPLILLSRLQGSLPVRVDPARPDRVVVQWDRLGDPAAYGMPTAAPGAMGVPMAAPGAPAGPGAGSDETLAQVAAAMAASGTAAAPVFAAPAQGGYSVEQLRAYVRASGISGTARIDQLSDSGSTIGDERLFTMTTTVFLPERIPFVSGPSAAMVPLEKVPRVAVGVELPVKVAPDNDNLVMFEWEKV